MMEQRDESLAIVPCAPQQVQNNVFGLRPLALSGIEQQIVSVALRPTGKKDPHVTDLLQFFSPPLQHRPCPK